MAPIRISHVDEEEQMQPIELVLALMLIVVLLEYCLRRPVQLKVLETKAQ
jgi:hypothetical protein